MTQPVMVTFVCWGNICRSPSARVVFEKLVADAALSESIMVDSSGTGNWHAGEPADKHAVEVGRNRGYDMTHKAKQFIDSDFEIYDLVVALDEDRAADLRALASSEEHRSKVVLLRSFDAGADHHDVPDPYGRGERAFEEMFDLLEPACEGLLEHIRTHYL